MRIFKFNFYNKNNYYQDKKNIIYLKFSIKIKPN